MPACVTGSSSRFGHRLAHQLATLAQQLLNDEGAIEAEELMVADEEQRRGARLRHALEAR